MRKNLLFIFAVFIAASAFGQTELTPKLGLYKWKTVVFMAPCTADGKRHISDGKEDGDVLSIEQQQFRIIRIDGSTTAIIQIIDYTTDSNGKNEKGEKTENLYNATPNFYKYNFYGDEVAYDSLKPEEINSRNYGDRQRYFSVNLILINEYVLSENMIGLSLASGVINFPFKYRPQKSNTDFSGAFNFGAGLGLKLPHKSYGEFTHTVLLGCSISNIVLDSSNTNKNQGKLASTNNFTGLSLSVGYLVEYKKVQIGLFIGVDYLNKINQREFDWQYHEKPWLSVAFGYSIFSEQRERPNTSEPSQNSTP